jgi:flagellin-like protein
MKNKRGISPLIAGVLLIAFTIALGAIIMTWARNFVEDQTDEVNSEAAQQMSCAMDVDIEFVRINDQFQVCNSTDVDVHLTVSNVGKEDIQGLKIQVGYDTGAVENFEDMTVTTVGNAHQYSVVLTASPTEGITYVSAMPYLDVPGTSDHRLCSEKKIEVTEIEDC